MRQMSVILIVIFVILNLVFAQLAMAMASNEPDSSESGFSNAEIDNRSFVSSIPEEDYPAGDIPEPADERGDGYYDESGIYENY